MALFDFDAGNVALLDNIAKTYSVVRFEDLKSGIPGAPVTVRETSREGDINGFTARLSTVGMDLQSAELQRMGSQLRLGRWTCGFRARCRGSAEVSAFYRRNLAKFPWVAMMRALNRGANPTLVASLAAFQRQISTMQGVPVLEIVKVKPAETVPPPRLSPAEASRVRYAIAELDAAADKGGPDAAAAAQEIGRLKALVRDDYLPNGPNSSLFEITLESLGFSADPIAPQTFAVPQDFRKVDPR